MTDHTNQRLILGEEKSKATGEIIWRSPSNIALVKYWGKYGQQQPRNPSVSFTLSNAFTDTLLEYKPKSKESEGGIELEFFFGGEKNQAFEDRIRKFLESLLPIFPFLGQLSLTLRSGNSFPHSAGIASSASAMSALALCLCTLEHRLFGTLQEDDAFDRKASYIARLGSGSACRSIYPSAAVWGKTNTLEHSSNDYAVPLSEDQLHPIFRDYLDDILIIASSTKKVSSTAGHALMDNHSFAEARYQQAHRNMDRMLQALSTGDLSLFGWVAEEEAMTLHALMLSSHPSYILLQPNTLTAIEKVRDFRKQTQLPLYFTLDAGPNLHLLYPMEHVAEIRGFIMEELTPLCEKGKFLDDHVGQGPQEI
jgi:diphosphomevalonate decarboxylase